MSCRERNIYLAFLIVTLSILEKDKLVRAVNNENVKENFLAMFSNNF